MKNILLIILLFPVVCFAQTIVTDTLYYSDGSGGYIKVVQLKNYNTTSFWPKSDTINGTPNQTVMTTWSAQQSIAVINDSLGTKKTIADSTGFLGYVTRWQGNKTRDSIIGLIPNVAGKVNVSDTATMLASYLKKSDTANMLIPYLRDTDTTSMLIAYARKTYFVGGTGISISSGTITNTFYPTSIDTISSARAFNTPYQMSTTKYVDVRLYATITPTLSLTGGQSGEIYLEVSANGSTNWVVMGKIANGNTGSLTIGLNITELMAGYAAVLLQPSYYWRLRTNNVSGTPTYTFNGGAKTVY